jgi:UDP-N-acetylglucosamine--N-acetylmuramyl-(pentapeptide) pyrophosphoryl-undecaprenol N-acetylglucosamine transferase
VPLPIGNGEQRLNAAGLAAAGGAVLVDNADFTPAWFEANVLPLLLDGERLRAMSRAARAQGRRDAAGTMAGLVLRAAGGGRGPAGVGS